MFKGEDSLQHLQKQWNGECPKCGNKTKFSVAQVCFAKAGNVTKTHIDIRCDKCNNSTEVSLDGPLVPYRDFEPEEEDNRDYHKWVCPRCGKDGGHSIVEYHEIRRSKSKGLLGIHEGASIQFSCCDTVADVGGHGGRICEDLEE